MLTLVNFNNHGLALTASKQPGPVCNKLALPEPVIQLPLVSSQLKKKHVASLSSELEPTIWSCDTGQPIPCFDRCQLIATWKSNIKEGSYKLRVHVSVNLLARVCPLSWATLSLGGSLRAGYQEN